MAARAYGDANENGGNKEDPYNQSKRRATRHYSSTTAHHSFVFKEFTRESLGTSQKRKASRAKNQTGPASEPPKYKTDPDPYLVSGQQLPPAFVRHLPSELIGKPIEDIDPYYEDQETFVIISRGKELTRFSAKKALYLLGPFHPIRRVALYILVNPIFNLFVILTILINCILMTVQGSETVEKTEIIFTIVYTTEMGLKVLARGFIVDNFTYLRDPWNWLDFSVIIMAYLTIVIQDLGNLSVMRTFRVLRALKTVAIIPGMKTIVGAVIDSVKNLKDVVVLTLFSLSVFSLLGLQIYMGILTQKCVLDGPSNMTDSEWMTWCSNSSHWIPDLESEIWGSYRLCGNATGAQTCPPQYTCLQGFGPNPDYGYTNFDTFGWALICSFRLMTQDFWEGLYMQVLKTAGSWHIIFFLVSIFLGSIYLMNLILAIVAMSYNELQRRAEEEEAAAAEDEAAFLESCRLMELQDQMSQYSASTPDVGTSYRPSVEIGIVGQSLLASLCHNGLLGQHVREKLDQQMILPNLANQAIRSHSLSVNLERRESQRANNQWMAGPTAHHHNPQYDPLTMATSMMELRRKSSVRTNDSDSPTSVRNSRSGSYLGQRRLLPDIGVSGRRLSRNCRQDSVQIPHHMSSSVLLGRQDSAQNNDTPNRDKSTRGYVARSSTASDKDLQLLKQKAAMIRIGNFKRNSEQTNLSLDEPIGFSRDGQRLSVEPRPSISFMGPRTDHDRRRSSSIRYGSVDLNRTSSTKPNPTVLYSQQTNLDQMVPSSNIVSDDPTTGRTDSKSDVAICEQPSRLYPCGRSASITPQPSSPKRMSIMHQQRRRNSTRSARIRRPSNTSNFGRYKQLPPQHPQLLSTTKDLAPSRQQQLIRIGARLEGNVAASTSGVGGSRNLAQFGEKIGGSMRTLVRSNENSSTTTNTTVSSIGRHQLGIESCLAPDKMHHLSVENFQQFGSGGRRSLVGGSLQVGSDTGTNLDQPGQILTSSNEPSIQQQAQRDYYLTQDQQSASDFYGNQPLRSRGRLESRQYIHPSTMVRSSFSRPRQSMIVGGSIAPGSAVRRMSRDFVRRASDWSRLSMSANVDLRRLLRLWSHTNPYQGRPSIGSCSNYSQTNQSNQFDMESPGSSIRGGGGGASYYGNSPRPSSVGSAWQAYEIISAMSRRNNRFRSNAGEGYAAIPLDDNMMDKMSINMRDKCLAYCLSCLDILCIWECCGAWLKIQRIIALIVFDPFAELFIILCILINTLFMALDSDDADEQMRKIFERGNYFFTATFAVEASMKIMALSPKFYFREGWNVFDSIIVGLSLLELGLEGVYGLSVLRSFRLLRVFKLAKSWPTLNLLISIMGKAVGDLGNLTFVLAIIVFIFAVMGMQLFGNKYEAKNFPNGELPRWNFTDFMHSFMIVFRILCAEWIEPMWDCLLVGGWPCIPFFLIAVTVGNLVVLNLFLALLLASFGASNLASPQADNVDTKKLQEAIGRFKRFGRWTRRLIGRSIARLTDCLLRKNNTKRNMMGISGNHLDDNYKSGKPMKSHIASMSRLERLQNIEKRTEELKDKIRRSPEHHYHLRQLARSQLEASAQSYTSTPGGYNYNYNKRASTGTNQQGVIPTIPIIVNEATEPTEEETSLSNEVSLPLNEVRATNIHDDNQANNDGFFNNEEPTSLSSDVSLHDSDFNATSTNDQCGPTSGCFNSLAKNQLICRMNYSSTMQPIREDSKDESTHSQTTNRQSESRNSSQSIESHQIEVPQLVQIEHATGGHSHHHPNVAPQMVGYSYNIDHDMMSSGSKNLTKLAGEHYRDKLDVHNCQQREPLLKSKSEPESFQRADKSVHLETSSCNKQSAPNDAIDVETNELRSKSSLYLKAPKREEMEEDDEKTLQHIETYIERCICVGIICLKWFLFRQYIRKIVEHRYFDQCILILIVISSGTLALEDKHLNDRPTLKQTLDVLDTIFTIIFSLEMVFKWLAFGMRRYFGNIWSWLDFIIVLVSFVNLMASIFGSGKIQALKTMRTLRAMRGLRPLRALQRFQGMRVVVNALIQAIPSIFNVLLVCLIFWLIFSIMGVQMFGGKFWRCLDPETRELVSYEVAANRIECLERNLTWANPQINFDNVLNAYLALFQVATFKGWIDIMNSATDSGMRDDQPTREANIYMYFYFVFFVIFGSFFTLNLFIGVIIDNFNEQKKKTGGSLEIFMTDDQKKYYHAMKKMRSKKPIKAMTRPKFKFQAYMFDITTSKKFDLAIMIIIGLNMLVMALEHYGQSQEFSNILENLNLIFIAIFTLECLCKIFAMRHFYFREPWNIFDFIVVDLSILGVVMKEYVAKYFVSPTLLRVVRVVKVGRVLRLVKGAKGIRTLLFALAMSLPALFNICLLLFLVMFIYAIFGMSFFMNVRKRSGIDETFNFETFSSSIIILFQMSTSAGWDLVLDPLMDEENDCQKPDPLQGIEGTCGNKGIAIFYLISYVIVTFLIIINMYIAVILENYSQATEDVQEGLTDDDYEMYYEIWQKFDPDGTQYLPYEKLSDFVDALEDPLRIPKPNDLALVVLDINIYAGNQCYCVDILDALTKYFFTRKGFVIQVNEHLQKVQSTLHETPFERITTTYLLKREHYCAKVIQNCWRKWKEQTRISYKNDSASKTVTKIETIDEVQ